MDRKKFQCSECSDGMTAFDTEEGLLSHKWSMIKATKRKSHMRCHVCKLDHRTFEGLVRHYQINHPAKQHLNCPGCNASFGRLYQLMDHLERDECPAIMADRVRQNRMLQVHATNMLAVAADSSEGPVQRIEGSPQTLKDMERIQSQRERHMDVLQDRLLEDEADRAAESERPNFSYSGVTLGDFGAFINIKPKVAEAMAVAVAVQNDAQTKLAAGQQFLLQYAESAASSRVPPTSAEAVDEMLRRQRELGCSNKADAKAQGTKKASTSTTGGGDGVLNTPGRGHKPVAKHSASLANADAASTRQSTREFRQGDSKGPDLLTDDSSPVSQRLKTTVWAGQESMDMHEGGINRAPGRAGAGIGTPALGTAAPGLRALSGNAASSTAKSNSAGDSQVPVDPNHPNHPRFDVNKYRDQFSGRYTCPHEICERSGKQYKTSRALIGHLLSETAHRTERQQCPSCFGWFSSLNALTQHIESQTTRCHFRETDEYVPFINILSAGVVDVQGHNADMTLAYSVQPTAAAALLEEGLKPANGDDDEPSVWQEVGKKAG